MKSQHKSSSPYPQWNNEKFEAKLAKEIEQRRNLISTSTNFILQNEEQNNAYQINEINEDMPLRPTGVYKQFLLIGVPPSIEDSHDPNVKPSVLIAYPPFEYPNMEIKRIIPYCMPTGHTRQFLSFNSLSPIQDEFVFQFTGTEGKPIYGVCVHVSTKDTSLPFYGTKADKDRIFCFCLMTKLPTFSVHFSFLTSLALWTIGHVRHLHKYENKIQVNISPGIPIDDLDLEDQIGHHPSINVPTSFQNEIASYFISNISSKPEKLSRASSTFMQGYVTRKLEKMNNRRHNFRYDTEDCSIELKFPPLKDISENCICWASLDTLFSLLSVADILQIISGLLLDRQVLIIGSHLEEVSMSIYALQSMLRPFNFAGTIIPVLPTSEGFIDILQLPTPFLFGVPRCNELKSIKFLETAVFVDLDKKNVPPIEDLPNYPNENYVRSELNKYFLQFKNKQELNEFGLPTIYKKTLRHKYTFSPSSCQKINEIISSPFQNSIYSNYICGFFVSCEGVTVFNEELFLGQVYSLLNNDPNELYGDSIPLPTREKEKEKKVNEEMEFWDRIVESATFQLYIEDRIVSFTAFKYNVIQDDNKREEDQSSEEKSNEEDDVTKSQKKDENAAANAATNAATTTNTKDENKEDKNQTSDNKIELRDIDKDKNKNNNNIKAKKDNLNGHQIKRKALTNRSISAYVEPKKNSPVKKYQIKKPQRIKSLKNVLDDLPTPSSSNNRLLDLDEDHVKSDTEIDDNQNENIKLTNKKVSKSSIFSVTRSKALYEEEEDKNDKKKNYQKKKRYNKFDSDTIDNDDDDFDVKNSSKLKPTKNANEGENEKDKPKVQRTRSKTTTALPNTKTTTTKAAAAATSAAASKQKKQPKLNSEDENEKNKKHKKSNESAKPQRKSSGNNNNDNSDDDDEVENSEDENERNRKRRRSTDKKPTTKSTKPQRKSSGNNNNDSDDDNEVENSEDENERNRKHRRSTDKKPTTKSTKPQRKSSGNNNDSDDDNEKSEDENERSKKHRRSSDKKLTTTASTKQQRRSSTNDDDDDENSNDEVERNKKHKKSNESKQSTTRNARPQRKASGNNNNNNDDDEIKSEDENERSKKHRRSSDKKLTTKSKPQRRSSGSNNNNNNNNKDDDNDDDEENGDEENYKSRSVKQPKRAAVTASESNKKKSKSQRPVRKSQNNKNNEDENDDDDDDEENSSTRSGGVVPTKRHRKSAPSISKNLQKLKQSSHQRSTRKSRTNGDEDYDSEDENSGQIDNKDRNPILRKPKQPTKQPHRSSNHNNNNDDDDDEGENDHEVESRGHKQRRKSAPGSRSRRTSRHDDNDDDDNDDDEAENEQKNRKKSNEKNDRNQKQPVVRKNPTQIMKNQLDNRKRTRNHNRDDKSDDGNKKKKIQIQFNSSSEDDTYSSSESFNPGVYYGNEQLDLSSDSYED